MLWLFHPSDCDGTSQFTALACYGQMREIKSGCLVAEFGDKLCAFLGEMRAASMSRRKALVLLSLRCSYFVCLYIFVERWVWGQLLFLSGHGAFYS